MTDHIVSKEYLDLVEELKNRVTASRYRAARSINRELLLLYHYIGGEIFKRQNANGWGSKVIEQLSRDLTSNLAGLKGFSPQNLKYMKRFYQEYSADEIGQQPVDQLPWGHHVALIYSVKEKEERLWYVKKAAEHGWSRNVLSMQVETKLFHREGKAVSNFKASLPDPQSDLVKQTIRNPYIFNFLDLGNDAHEREVERGLVNHIERFLLELGEGFAFLGRQYHIQVEDEDFYLDLLFYHIKLRCFVVIDLKANKFKPEYAGKMNFYLSAVDDLIKHPSDNPSIGLILCRSEIGVMAEYALRDINKPIGLAQYQLTKALPENLKTALPTIEELENELSKDLEGNQMKINLTEKPEIVTLQPATFVYIEKIGPFLQQAPLAWQEFWAVGQMAFNKENTLAMLGLSMIDKKKKGDDAFIYQAGVSVKSELKKMPQNLKKRELPSGRYARFLLTGSYSQLAEAYPQAFESIAKAKLAIRDEFCMESYLNTPADTAENDLKTEILIPIH